MPKPFTILTLANKANRSLLITGPKGCGKTLLARSMAEHYLEISVSELISRFNVVLDTEPTYIVYLHHNLTEKELDSIKSVLTKDTVKINARGKNPYEIVTPTFIFIAEGPPNMQAFNKRLFKTITIGA